MHIPDGFLSAPVWIALDVTGVPAVAWLARRAARSLEDTHAPLLGVMGAFVFAAQMINFPVGVGASGHLVGGALLACTLGPAPAALVMTAILLLQALVFQDGGILALGANVWNMAILGVLAGYLPFHYWSSGAWRRAAVFVGGLLSVLVSACLAISELLLSGVAIPAAALGLSLVVFLVTAMLEGAITLAVFQSLESLDPGWVRPGAAVPRRALGALATAAVLLACVGVLVASAAPDGLERLADQVGIADRARSLIATPLADYELRGLASSRLGKAAAGLAGLALVYGVCVVVSRRMTRRGSP